MATNQGYQQVVVVPTVVPARQSSSWRRGFQIGGIALGLPCVICLSIFGFIFVSSGIGLLSSDDDFDDPDFELDDDPLEIAGIVMLVIGGLFIAAAMGLCYLGCRECKRYKASNSSGRVINASPTVQPPPPGTAQPLIYQQPTAGAQMTPYLAPPPGQPQLPTGYVALGPSPGYGQPPDTYMAPGQGGNQIPGYPGPPPAQPYAAGPPPAYAVQPSTYAGQPSVYPVQPGYHPNQQFGAEVPQAFQSNEGLPIKPGMPGQVDSSADPYERPPPFAP